MISLGGYEFFGISELRTWNAEIQIGSYGLNLKTFGNELYRENALELAGGFLLYKTLSAGIGIDLLNNWIKEYTNRFTYAVKLGAGFDFTDLKCELCLNNINLPRFSEIDYLPFGYLLGLQYRINPHINPYIYAMGKQTDRPFFNFGLSFMPVNKMECYAGVRTENFLFEYGMRIDIGHLGFLYAGSSHRQLGLSHGFYINFLNP
jgi:hypothetical protein